MTTESTLSTTPFTTPTASTVSTVSTQPSTVTTGLLQHSLLSKSKVKKSNYFNVRPKVDQRAGLLRRSPRLSPWAATFLHIYLTCLHHCEVTPSLSAAVCDDTQIYVALLPANYNQNITALESCLNSFRIWFSENGTALNPTKSVSILFGTSQKLKSLSRLNSVNVAG